MKNPIVSGSFACTFPATSSRAARMTWSWPFFARMIAVMVSMGIVPFGQ